MLFQQLQAAYAPQPEYGYDRLSCWRRAAERVRRMLEIPLLATPGARVLEASCGDGMTGFLLACYGHGVQLHDLEDWRDSRAGNLPFVAGDLRPELPLPAASFDFLCSYNAFEHVSDPAAALTELLRLCRPEGLILLEFGPLYASPWGLHAFRTLRMPYPQFLFSEAFVDKKLAELGIRDLGKKRDQLQPLNRWRAQQFAALWNGPGCELLDGGPFPADPPMTDIILRHPAAFRNRGLTWEDVTTQGFRVLLKKTA